VVIDKQGRLVHTAAGLMSRSTDILTGSLLLAAGKISATRFQETLNPQPTTAASDATVRAERLTQLARQLARRHLEEMAAEKYAEAIKLDPHQMDAHLEMGKLLLKRRGLAEAEKHFRLVLANQPGSVEGVLGLAFVQMLRGGGETDEAERAVRTVLAKNASQPRAHYLLGLILERRGQMDRAAASFKRAADLLMERSEQE
jgi:Tfp pilus assembly protein PilF